MINIIVAVSNERDRAIGKDNKLLLHNKEDLQEFKRLTSQPSSVLVCGRKTYESLPEVVKKRVSLIFGKYHTTLDQFKSMDFSNKTIWIIGGGEIYKKMIEENLVDSIYLTTFDKELEGDTFFPQIPENFVCKHITYFKTFKRKIYEKC